MLISCQFLILVQWSVFDIILQTNEIHKYINWYPLCRNTLTCVLFSASLQEYNDTKGNVIRVGYTSRIRCSNNTLLTRQRLFTKRPNVRKRLDLVTSITNILIFQSHNLFYFTVNLFQCNIQMYKSEADGRRIKACSIN